MDELKNYELLYIVPNQYTEEEFQNIKKKIDELLTKHGAIIGYEEFLGKKKLAYTINKVAHGYYQVTEFELADTQNLQAINNSLRLDKEILRAQIIIKKKLTEAERLNLKKREEYRPEEKEEKTTVPAKKTTAKKAAEDKKVSIENLDEKLDEILKTDDLL